MSLLSTIRVAPFEQPDVRPISVRAYLLKFNFWVEWEENGARFRMCVLGGFVTDLASVPRLLWTLSNLIPGGLIRAGAVVHDWIYMHRGRMTRGVFQVLVNGEWQPCQQAITRARADRLFKAINDAAGMSRFNAWKAWIGVRLAGFIAWWTDDSEELDAMFGGSE